jgi:hypothetical protein
VNIGVARDDLSWAPLGIGWLAANRPATQMQAIVPPGGIGSFTFDLRAPTAPGAYLLPLRLVVDGLAWLDDQGVFVQITVVP